MVCFILQPSYGEETPARMFQNDAIDWDLDIVISQSLGKVKEDRHLIKDGKEHREGSPQGKVNEGEEEN
jgi:hypothetical protein